MTDTISVRAQNRKDRVECLQGGQAKITVTAYNHARVESASLLRARGPFNPASPEVERLLGVAPESKTPKFLFRISV